MSSKLLYDKIFNNHINHIKNGNIETDCFLSSQTEDNRRGISLVIPIPFNSIKYSSLINMFRDIESDQYYYPLSDLHITIFTFLSARDTYKCNKELENEFIHITKTVLDNLSKLSISFAGITFSKEAGFINGYDNDVLISIRDDIRKEMDKQRLRIDERYKSETAHVTFMRFKNRINDINRFYNKIIEIKDIKVEELELRKIELVEHDWYNTESNKRIISTFNIKE
jgi:hypothetical protein